MRILLLGGIGEAVRLARLLATAHELTYSLAGKAGSPVLPCAVRCGGFGGASGLAEFLCAQRIELLLDVTHPYAAHISSNAVTAAQIAQIPLWAYRRPPWRPVSGDDWRGVADWAELSVALQSFRRPFFTIGLEPLTHSAAIPSHQHWLVRCLATDAPPAPRLTVVRASGPFTLAQELELLQRHGIDVIIAKNSGGRAVVAKLTAAWQLRLPVILLERPRLPRAPREFMQVEELAGELLTLVTSDNGKRAVDYTALQKSVVNRLICNYHEEKAMDVGGLFDQLLQSGRELVAKGQNLAEEKFGIPSQAAQREETFSSMGKGAAMAGVAALLLGTRVGRGLTGVALKLGSLGAIGGLAYKTFQDWQAKNAGAAAALPELGPTVNVLSGQQLEKRSLTLLKAMIAAAKADGHIDDRERSAIDGYLQKLNLDAESQRFVLEELGKPLNAKEVAAGADSSAAAAEIYLTSLLAINLDNAQERAYMEELARELKLPPELVSELLEQANA